MCNTKQKIYDLTSIAEVGVFDLRISHYRRLPSEAENSRSMGGSPIEQSK